MSASEHTRRRWSISLRLIIPLLPWSTLAADPGAIIVTATTRETTAIAATRETTTETTTETTGITVGSTES